MTRGSQPTRERARRSSRRAGRLAVGFSAATVLAVVVLPSTGHETISGCLGQMQYSALSVATGVFALLLAVAAVVVTLVEIKQAIRRHGVSPAPIAIIGLALALPAMVFAMMTISLLTAN